MNTEKLSEVLLFEKDIETLYNEKIKPIDSFVKRYSITHVSTEDDLKRYKDITFEALWKWSDPKIDRNSIKKDSKEVLLHPDDALIVLYPGRNSIEYTFHKAVRAAYTIPYGGEVLNYAPKGMGIRFIGNPSDSYFDIYLYTDKEINEEVGIELRGKRDKILDRIDQVLEANRHYTMSKVDDFKKLISDFIEEIYGREKKRNDINNLL